MQLSRRCDIAACIGRRRKFWEISCTECTGQGNDSDLIRTVKMETRNPVEGYFDSDAGEQTSRPPITKRCLRCSLIVARSQSLRRKHRSPLNHLG